MQETPSRPEIAFIDTGITELDSFLAGLRPEVEPILLTAAEPAALQMARALQGRSSLEAVHVVAHGAPGEIHFAGGMLSVDTLGGQGADLAEIGRALDSHGGLNLWTCNTAAGGRGRAFLEALSRAAESSVAGSSQRVGAAESGGVWALDQGAAGAQAPLSALGRAAYRGVMATYTWKGPSGTTTGPVTGLWNTAANWSPNGTPGAGDTVNLQGNSSSNGYTVTVDTTVSVARISISSASTGGATLNLNGQSVTATQQLQIQGGTVDVGNGTLNVGAMSYNGTGGLGTAPVATLKLGGGTVTVNTTSNVTFNTGTITGKGTYSSTKAIASTGNSLIEASGGTLEISANITDSGNNLKMKITGTGDTLKLNGTSETKAVDFNGQAGTLEIGAGATLTIGTAVLNIDKGTVILDRGDSTLTSSAGIAISTGSIEGVGKVTGGVAISTTSGHVDATGGTLEFASGVVAVSGVQLNISNVAGSVLKFDGAVGSSVAKPTIFFQGTGANHGVLNLQDIANLSDFYGILSSLEEGDAIYLPANANSVTTEGSDLVVKNSSGDVIGRIQIDGTVPIYNYDSNSDIISIVCFLQGTGLLTRSGYRAVEELAVGDEVMTLADGWQQVRWIGWQTLANAGGAATPVRIARDAFGAGLPSRDLWVSPEHAIFFRDHLIPAKTLVNGNTVTFDSDVENIVYYHVLLERHAVVFSNGLPTESYVPSENEQFFANAGEIPADLAEAVMCRIGPLVTDCFPRVTTGPVVETARAHLGQQDGPDASLEAVA